MSTLFARELSTLLALVIVAAALAVPAWIRERRPSAYQGLLRRVGERLPPPRRFVAPFALAYVLLLALDVVTNGAIYPRDPLWIGIALGVLLASAAGIALGLRRVRS